MMIHVLGFIRGSLRFGGDPHTIRQAVIREFPRLTPVQVDEAVRGALEEYGPPLRTLN